MSTFSLLFLIRSFSNLQVTGTGIKSRTSSNSGRIGSVTWELLALEGRLNFQQTYYGISKISWPILIKFYICIISGMGERLPLGFIKTGCHGNRKLPLTYDGENEVSTLTPSILIRSSSNLQVTRTGIKSRTNSNFGQIGPLPLE